MGFLPDIRKTAKVAGGVFAASQVATVAALLIVDSRRKKHRHDINFPSAPVREVPAGEGGVTVYTKGRDLYTDMLASIEGARETVYFETYIWKADRVGLQFKNALIAASERGVEVGVVYDVIGNLVVPRRFYDFPDHVHVLRHTPWVGMRGPIVMRSPGLNHRKLMVVDGKQAYVGGYNIGSLYATRWRDTHVRLTGPGVAELENAFVDYWNQSKHKGLPTLPNPSDREWGGELKVTRNVPSVAVYPIRYMYLEAIDRARERIWMTHAYLIPDDDLMLALFEAVDRGVDVRIVVPAESNHIVADWLSRGFYTRLLRHGVRLFLYQDAMVHAKTATIDGMWSTIGTANIDRLSLMGNYELNLEVLDAAVATRMEEIFDMDSGNCRELTLEEWQARPLAAKVSETVLLPMRPLL